METLAAQVGMTEAEIESAIEHADSEQLADLLYATETALADLERAEGVVVEEAELPRGVEEMASRHARNVKRAAKALKRGDISLDEFTGRVQKSVADNWEKAHRMGRGRKLDAGDEEWLKGAVRAETGYARKFGQDIVADKVSDKRLDQRSRMYGASVNSSWWNAKVESQPPGTEMDWVLGNAEHCPDCLILAANSPYTAQSLPTVPKAGDTACLSHCKCKIRFRRGRRTPADDQYSERKEQTLAQMAGHGRPPKGMRAPTPVEQDYIDELRTRMNYHRRKVAAARTAGARKRHMAERKRYNRELIDFTEKENIHEIPFWSVDDVIDGRHIGIRAEGDVFRNGLDGRTLAMLSEDELSDLLERMGASAGKRFSTLDKYGGPEIRSTPPKLEAGENSELDELAGGAEYNLVAEGLPATWALLADVLRAARGRVAEVGPLGDRLLARAHVWVRGRADDVGEILEFARDAGHDFAAVPVRMRARRRIVT